MHLYAEATGLRHVDPRYVRPKFISVKASFNVPKRNNMALVDAAHRDIVDAVKTESVLEGLEEGSVTKGVTGTGPSQMRRAKHAEKAESARAASYAENLKERDGRKDLFTPDSFTPKETEKKGGAPRSDNSKNQRQSSPPPTTEQKRPCNQQPTCSMTNEDF